MKKGLRKLVAAVLTATMAMSIGMPAFASSAENEKVVSMTEKEEILSRLSEEYDLEKYGMTAGVRPETRSNATLQTASEFEAETRALFEMAIANKQNIISKLESRGVDYKELEWKTVDTNEVATRASYDYSCTKEGMGHDVTLRADLTPSTYTNIDVFGTVLNATSDPHGALDPCFFMANSYTTDVYNNRRFCDVLYTGTLYFPDRYITNYVDSVEFDCTEG